jgi:transcriptional/translational regulatory protein YebC/TACO1
MSWEELELELIDYGADEMDEDEGEIIIYGDFAQNSTIQKYLEDNGYEITSSEFVRIPNDVKEVTPEQREAIEKLIEKIEEADDVQNVFHNMKEDDSAE